MEITVYYSAVDGFKKTRKFKTIKGAQKFAQGYIGEHPDMGRTYAVSFDGVGKIEVEGTTLESLFPSNTPVPDSEDYEPS
jgi:hypothetical protein